MTRYLASAALLLTLGAAGLTPAVAASTAPPTDPQNLQGAAPSAQNTRSSQYAPGRASKRRLHRKHVPSQTIEQQDFGRPIAK